MPVRRSREYAAAARVAGDQVELVNPPRADHHAHIDPRSEAWQAVTRWLGAWALGSRDRGYTKEG